MPSRSALACSSVTPGLRRPSTYMPGWLPRDCGSKNRRVRAGQGHPDVLGRVELEVRGQHAHHGVGHAAERQALAEDVRILAEAPHPEAMGEHHHRSRAEDVLLGEEVAPQRRIHAQQGQHRGAHETGSEPLGDVHPGEIEGPAPEGGQVREALLLRPPVQEVGDADAHLREGGRALMDEDEPLRSLVRQRPQQHAVHHAEDGGVGADAERQREHRGHA